MLMLKNIFRFLTSIFKRYFFKLLNLIYCELNWIYFLDFDVQRSTFKVLTSFSSVQFNELNNWLNAVQILFSSTSLAPSHNNVLSQDCCILPHEVSGKVKAEQVYFISTTQFAKELLIPQRGPVNKLKLKEDIFLSVFNTWSRQTKYSTQHRPASCRMQMVYLELFPYIWTASILSAAKIRHRWLLRWLSFIARKLKVSILPWVPVWYCRQSVGGLKEITTINFCTIFWPNLLCAPVWICALQLCDLDVPHSVVAGSVEGEGQRGGVTGVGADVHVHWRGKQQKV